MANFLKKEKSMRGFLGAVLLVLAPVSITMAAQHVDLGTIDKDLQVTVLQAENSKTVVQIDIGGFDKTPVRIDNELFYSPLRMAS